MKIWNSIKRFLYAIPYGMKGGDTVIQNTAPTQKNINIMQNICHNNLGEDLLKGELSQQVQELRYEDYKVYNESKKYRYIGEGQVIKKESSKKHNDEINFFQDNKIICESVYDELKRLDKYSQNRYNLNFLYLDIPRFKLENYCTFIHVKIYKKKCNVYLHFSAYPDQYNIGNKAFLNELTKIKSDITQDLTSKIDIITNIQQISFVTYKAKGEDDFVKYNFSDFSFRNIEKTEHEFILEFDVKNYQRENLLLKFYSDSMQKKYDEKAPKNKTFDAYAVKRIEHCDLCGNEMNVYDADITKETFGKKMCTKCLESFLLKKYQNN